MSKQTISAISRKAESLLATNKVLRNTYIMLSLTFIFSAFMAYVSTVSGVRYFNPLIMILGMYGLMFLTHALRNSPWGLVAVFAFTGFMGYSLGPVLNLCFHQLHNGSQIVATALGGTGMIFFALSAYVLTTGKDFSYLAGFLFSAVVVAMLVMIAGMFFNMPIIQLVVSAAFMLISSGLILLQTSEIIHGGETNYISATVSLFVSIYNLFISLLNIITTFSNRD